MMTFAPDPTMDAKEKLAILDRQNRLEVSFAIRSSKFPVIKSLGDPMQHIRFRTRLIYETISQGSAIEPVWILQDS